MSRTDLELLLSELLRNREVNNFGIEWILKRPGATEDSVREAYQFLKSKDISDIKIATYAPLLGSDKEILWNNYRNLEEMGLKKTRIATNAYLLGRDQETLWDNYHNLEKMGLTAKQIATNAALLGQNQETLWNNYHNLEKMGLNKAQIATNAQLLNLNPKSVRSKYDFLVGLLTGDYADRTSGKEVVLNNPGLLGNSRVTVESSVQFLQSLGVDYGKNSLLLSTTVQKKRERMAWMLREVFDYGESPQEKKKDLIHSMHDLFRDQPNLLLSSVNYLEKRKDQLREKATEYLR